MKKFDLKKILLIVIPIILFAFLALYIQAGYSIRFENWVYAEAVEHMKPFLTNIIRIITHLGDPIIVTSITILLVIIPKTRKKVGYPMAAAVIVSEALNLILKEIFARERPNILQLVNETTYSFPSGHAMINTTVYTMLGIFAIKYIRSKKIKISVIIMCIIMPLIISFSRVYLGVHYAGDVLGGMLLGFAVTVFIYALLKKEEKLLQAKNIS